MKCDHKRETVGYDVTRGGEGTAAYFCKRCGRVRIVRFLLK